METLQCNSFSIRLIINLFEQNKEKYYAGIQDTSVLMLKVVLGYYC